MSNLVLEREGRQAGDASHSTARQISESITVALIASGRSIFSDASDLAKGRRDMSQAVSSVEVMPSPIRSSRSEAVFRRNANVTAKHEISVLGHVAQCPSLRREGSGAIRRSAC